ncbi:cyclase [Noviherbaspirillum autotrophicum]|uniref:Cyclase n=2 Tax=Noviherbaspirillum autotrophicum TaxID=709839 RepID=A0A0C1YRW3_9BURK|nr:cyclase [Noviherbaspirillum autotrophicum]
MSTVEESIDVDVPISTAYNQWTQFEDFPQFMSSVHEVRQFDDTRLHWKATVAGKEKQWDAEITHQIPDKKIAWRSTTGVPNAGAVTFDRLSDTRTRINLKMSYSPETFTEKVGDTLGAVKLQAKQNLSRFKEMLESRGTETGAWRGTVAQPHH